MRCRVSESSSRCCTHYEYTCCELLALLYSFDYTCYEYAHCGCTREYSLLLFLL